MIFFFSDRGSVICACLPGWLPCSAEPCIKRLKLSAVTSKLLQLEALAASPSQLVSVSGTFGESDRRINTWLQLRGSQSTLDSSKSGTGNRVTLLSLSF